MDVSHISDRVLYTRSLIVAQHAFGNTYSSNEAYGSNNSNISWQRDCKAEGQLIISHSAALGIATADLQNSEVHSVSKHTKKTPMQPNRTSNIQNRITGTLAPIIRSIIDKLRVEIVLKQLSYPFTTASFLLRSSSRRIKIFLITPGYNFKKVQNSSLGARKLKWMGNVTRRIWFVRCEADDTVDYCGAGVGNKWEVDDSEKKNPMRLREVSRLDCGGHDTQYCNTPLLKLGVVERERRGYLGR